MSPPQPTALLTICVPEFRRQKVQTAECHVGSQARPRFVEIPEIPEPVPARRIGNAGLGAASTKMRGLRPLSPEEKKETQDAE
jgi:hypothetical protein